MLRKFASVVGVTSERIHSIPRKARFHLVPYIRAILRVISASDARVAVCAIHTRFRIAYYRCISICDIIHVINTVQAGIILLFSNIDTAILSFIISINVAA